MLFTGDTMRYEILKFENIRNMRLDRGFTQKQIAKQIGISRSYVSRIEKRALEKLRQALEN